MADHALATITNPSAALTDFTLIVDLANMPASWWSAVDTSDGTKGRVYKGDGSTELACDWIDFDDIAETGLLRVKWSGTLATSGTQQLWIEPPLDTNDSVAADDTYGSDNAYASHWEGYWPLTNLADRTSNGLDLTDVNTATSGATGKLGSAYDFASASSECLVNTSAPITSLPYTMLAWAKAEENNPSAQRTIISYCDSGDAADYLQVAFTTSGTIYFRERDVGADYTTATDYADEAFHHVGVVYYDNEGAKTIVPYVDGSSPGSDSTITGSKIAAYDTLGIGMLRDSTPSEPFEGIIDEVQLHSAQLSAEWIAEEYAQTNNNATFWGSWTWVAAAGGETISAECSDGLTFSDSDVAKATLQATASDGLATSDTDSTIRKVLAMLADGASFSDSSVIVRTISAAIADGVSFSDSFAAFIKLFASIADGTVFSDTAAYEGTISALVSDGFTVSDAASALATLHAVLADGITLADLSTLGSVISALVGDGISLSDASSAAITLLAQLLDGITVSDSGAVKATFSVTAADGVEFADLVAVLARLGATVSDSITLTDSSREASTLVPGIMRVSFSAGQAEITFSVSRPSIGFAGAQPTITFTGTT